MPSRSAEPPLERYALRPSEAAKALGIHRNTLENWRKRGLIRSVKIENTRLFPVAEIKRCLGQLGHSKPAQ